MELSKTQKLSQLKKLGKIRQNKCYPNYKNIGDFHNKGYESEFVSPYSNTANNVDSPIMILLLDWSSEEKLSGPFDAEAAKLGFTPLLPTNRNLKTLLESTFQLKPEDVFVTNIFPFIKDGGMSSRIPQDDIDKAFKEFCLPQIEIVNPSLVICCGAQVYKAISKSLGVKTYPKLHDHIKDGKITYYYQRHPGSRGLNPNGGIEEAKLDWKKMKKAIELK